MEVRILVSPMVEDMLQRLDSSMSAHTSQQSKRVHIYSQTHALQTTILSFSRVFVERREGPPLVPEARDSTPIQAGAPRR